MNANFAVTLSAPSGQTVSVGYATADGTATAGSDYVGSGGNVVFTPGQTAKTLTVQVTGDLRDELDEETFMVNLSNPRHATIADPLGIGTIVDDDAPPTLSINDVIAVAEGDAGTVAATFTVSLSAASGHPVSVDYATANDSATAPADYTAVSGTLTFDPGESSRTVTVQVKGDVLDEVNETFFVNLSNPANATIADSQGRATITDDDPLPTLAIDDVTIAEGDTGTAVATFTVTLSPVSGREVRVNYATANGTATTPSDYAAIPTTALIFAPGETTKQVTVLVNGDTLNEADETFSLNLSNPTNATVSDAQGLGTITNDDPLPALAIHDVTVTEGNTGTVGAAFTVSLNTPSARIVTVNYATAPGSAISGTDYQAASGSLTFLAGQTSKTITVLVNGDVADEEIENFFVNLSSPDFATIADAQGIGTILDNDGQPALSINDMTVTEGQSGTVNANFTVTLAPASGQTVTVGYATADGTATAGSDYVAKVDNLVFSPNQTTKTLTVQVNGDLRDELEETFTVTLSGAINATIDDPEGTGTITDDDAPPTLAIDNVTVAEGNSGTTPATFTVSLGTPSGLPVSVDYETANGTAISPADYAAGSGTLNFAAGETTKPVTVLVTGDTLDEINETFTVDLSNASNATILDPQGIGTITDDDAVPLLSVSDVTVTEGQQRHGRRNLHGHARARQRPRGYGQLRDGERNGDSARRLHRGPDDTSHVRCRGNDEAGDRARPRRHGRRGERDVLRQPVERRQRRVRRWPGTRHDHK